MNGEPGPEDGDQYRIEDGAGCTSVQVPFVHHVASMPYAPSYLEWVQHRDGCPRCNLPSFYGRPCLRGAVLQERLSEQLRRQHAASHQN